MLIGETLGQKQSAGTQRKIPANEFLRDLRSGLERSRLIQKYQLSEQNLARVLEQIITKGLLDHQKLEPLLMKDIPSNPSTRGASTKSYRIWTPEEIQTLEEQVAIGAHTEFVSGLLSRFRFNERTKSKFHKALEHIHEKEIDRRLFLGVIGEFSSGKSTFINTLISDDLLCTDVIQATTAAATELHYGKELNCEVYFKNGEKRLFFEKNPSLLKRFVRWLGRRNPENQKVNIRKFIHSFTADEKTAKSIKKVKIFHPSETLNNGMVIVDTPGTNSEEKRHAQVTQWALQNICDAAVVVIPADIPVSQTLISFLTTHLSDVLHRCIFVVTKLDLLRPYETERQLQAIRARLKANTGLKDPLILGCAPQLIVDDFYGDHGEKNNLGRLSEERRNQLLQKFHEIEIALWSTLREQKLLIQLEHLSVLMFRLLNQLGSILKNSEDSYNKQHKALETNKIPDLWKFVADGKTKHLAEFDSRINGIQAQAVNGAINVKKKCLVEIGESIHKARDRKHLKAAIKVDVGNHVKKAMDELNSRLSKHSAVIGLKADDQYDCFKKDFNKKYGSLTPLGGKIVLSGKAFEHRKHATDDKNIKASINEIRRSRFRPFGTTVVFLLGEWVAGLFGPSFETLQEKCWNELKISVETEFEKIKKDVLKQIETELASAKEKLSEIIGQYYQKYDHLVNKMIERDEKEKSNLVNFRHKIMGELKQVKLRRDRLQQVRQNLCNL